jgi:hypothetical protein
MDHSVLPPASGAAYPVLQPAVDQDGIALGGVALPRVQAPLGTYYGWNLRKDGFAEGELCSLTGSFIPFAKVATSDDSRAPLADRYASKAAYLDAVQAAADQLVADGLMLADDVGFVMERAKAEAVVLD